MNEDRPTKKNRFLNRLIVAALLMLFWIFLSGQYDAFHLTLGALCSLLVAHFGHDMMIREYGKKKSRLKKFGGFLAYVPWLMYQVILANFHVAYLVLKPGNIDPQLVRYRTSLQLDFAQVTLANSITLTPGTITMHVENDEYIVHALSQKVVDDLMTGEMEERVGKVFLEQVDGAAANKEDTRD